MNKTGRAVAAIEWLLLFPAAVFMTALVVRRLPQYAQAAQQVVLWYAVRKWTLWMLLIALPLAVLTIGVTTLRQRRGADLTTFLVGAATATAGAVLAVVIAHMLAN